MQNQGSGCSGAARAVDAWLKAAGWRPAKLAERAHLSGAVLSKLKHGHQELGRHAALEIEKAMAAAFLAGEVSVSPLRADDLCPPPKRKGDEAA